MKDIPGRHLLSAADAAWLKLDSPENSMVITAVLIFEGHLSFAQVQQLMRQRLLIHQRFRERVVPPLLPLAPPCWEIDVHFDLAAHIRKIETPVFGGQKQFSALLTELMSVPLDPHRPLWQAYVIDNAQGHTALVMRLHHCLGDGISMVRLLNSLSDQQLPQQEVKVGIRRPPKTSSYWELVQRFASQSMTLIRLLLLPQDSTTPFRGTLGTRKQVAWTRPLALEAIKNAALGFDASVNDVLCAAVTGALREYLLRRGCLKQELRIRSLVPMFFKDSAKAELGNHFGLVFLDHPVDLDDVAARIGEIKRSMDHLKQADDALVAFEIMDAIGYVSLDLERLALETFTRKASLLTTNIPGPAELLTIGGHVLRDILVWAPVSGHIGLSITFLSYAGYVRMAVCVDSQLQIAPEEITESFERDLDQMLRLH